MPLVGSICNLAGSWIVMGIGNQNSFVVLHTPFAGPFLVCYSLEICICNDLAHPGFDICGIIRVQ